MTYIKKEILYELLENFERLYPEATAAFRVAVAEMPEGLVRCKECAYYHNGIKLCEMCNVFFTPDHFCAEGEAKEGDV